MAKLLKSIVEQEKPHSSSSASRRSTTTSNQTGQMLAALLAGLGDFASKLTLDKDKARVVEVDSGDNFHQGSRDRDDQPSSMSRAT